MIGKAARRPQQPGPEELGQRSGFQGEVNDQKAAADGIDCLVPSREYALLSRYLIVQSCPESQRTLRLPIERAIPVTVSSCAGPLPPKACRSLDPVQTLSTARYGPTHWLASRDARLCRPVRGSDSQLQMGLKPPAAWNVFGRHARSQAEGMTTETASSSRAGICGDLAMRPVTGAAGAPAAAPRQPSPRPVRSWCAGPSRWAA